MEQTLMFQDLAKRKQRYLPVLLSFMLIINNRTELIVANDLFELPITKVEKKLDLFGRGFDR